MIREIDVHMPELHAVQRRIVDSKAKRKVIVTGRQVGKTTLAACVAVAVFMAGRRFLYAAPEDKQTVQFWDAVTGAGSPDDGGFVYPYLRHAIDAGLVYRNRTTRLLEGRRIAANGRIQAKTAHDADSLRGDNADVVWLDEFAIMDPDAWPFVLAPMLLRRDGDAYFSTTPQRKNHAYAAYMRGLQDETGRWQSFHATSFDNPFLSAAALAEMAADLGGVDSDAYRQEILAEFLENEGAVFHNIGACLYDKPGSPADHDGHWIVAGLDWGKENDYTATSVMCGTCKAELAIERFRGQEYRLQRPRLGTIWERWGVGEVHAEANAMGGPNIEELQASGWRVVPFTMGAESKPPLIEGMVLSLDKAEYRWLSDPIPKAELEAYERKVSPVTGRSTYSAPSGVHDDTVIARCLARRAVSRGPVRIVSLFP